MTQPHQIDREAVDLLVKKLRAPHGGAWRKEAADLIEALSRRPAPMEAVAWRLRRVGSEQWNFWDTPPWLALPVYADATKWDVQPLYTHPVQGGEG